MKLNFGKRLVLFLHWLLSLLACVLAVGLIFWPEVVTNISGALAHMLGQGILDMAGVALIAVYAILCVLAVVFILSRDKKKGDRGFITVDSSEAGRTRIAIGAVEQMIRQAIRGVDGIADMKSSIINNEDAISINTSVAIASGAHVPTVTMNIQRAIRSYIELNCGVAVREVSVSVHSLESTEDGGKQGRRKGVPAAAAPVASVYQPPVVEQIKEEPVVQAEPVESAVDEPVQEEAAEELSDAPVEACEEPEVT